MQQEPIITRSYELLKQLIGILKNFPKDQRFLLGDRIQSLMADILELLIEAYYSPKQYKKNKLHKVNILIEKQRHYLRLCYELGYYNSKKYHTLAKALDEIGRMVGGWIKTLP